MTAWRPAPIRQDEIERDTEEQNHGAGDPPATIPATAEIAEQPSARRGLGEAIKQLFREVKKALTGKSPAPKPKRRRKRGEDTRGLFKKLALKILVPVARSIFPADFAWFMPPDELDETQRLMMRQRRDQDAMWQQPGNEAFHYDQQNHLSPRL